MTTIRVIYAALFATSIALTAPVQAQSDAGASAPKASSTMPHDCAKPMTRHSHAADKGLPMTASMSGPCEPTAAASAAKNSKRHNHAEFHKNS